MRSSLRRGVVAATAIALSTVSLTACGAGFNAQTSGVNPDNASTRVGDLKIQNVNIVTGEDGEGPAAVSARIFNDGDTQETLRGLTVSGAGGSVELAPAEGEDLKVPAGGSLMLGGEDNASATLTDLGEVQAGNAQPITFDFSSTGKVELRATVVPARGAYAEYAATEEPAGGGDDAANPDEDGSAEGEGGTGEIGADQGGTAGEGTAEEDGAGAAGAEPGTETPESGDAGTAG